MVVMKIFEIKIALRNFVFCIKVLCIFGLLNLGTFLVLFKNIRSLLCIGIQRYESVFANSN